MEEFRLAKASLASMAYRRAADKWEKECRRRLAAGLVEDISTQLASCIKMRQKADEIERETPPDEPRPIWVKFLRIDEVPETAFCTWVFDFEPAYDLSDLPD